MIDLLAAMRRHFAQGARSGGAVAAETARVLAALGAVESVSPVAGPVSDHPALRALAALLAADGEVLDGRLAPLADRLPWRYGYAQRPDAPGLETRMAWAELVGPKAPIVSHAVGFGLTLIGPGTHYRPHRHPAVELYNVVAGTAVWSAGGRSAPRPPGSFILHPSDVVHAVRTEGDALLAIYSWTGDIVSPSVWAPI